MDWLKINTAQAYEVERKVDTTRVLLSYVSRDFIKGLDVCVGAMPLGA